jgi:Uma2 family endonuclease
MSGLVENIRHKLTVTDYYRMGEVGIFHEDDRVELIEGDLIDMAPIGSKHASTVSCFERLLIKAVEDKAIVYGQNPLKLSNLSVPQPDIMVLKPSPDDYFNDLPQPDDVLLLIEVADSSINFDRKTKLPLYASAFIPEIWLIDLNAKTLERYTQPNGESYTQCEILNQQDKITLTFLPDLTIELGQVLR